MPGIEHNAEPVFTKTIVIDAPATKVWDALTQPMLMKQWMSETDIDITTDWTEGSRITIRGQLYKKPFENSGKVITFQPTSELRYTHLSSLSRLPDVPENHTVLSFRLTTNDATQIDFSIKNFPSETIYKHLAFYWNVSLELLKRFVEKQSGSAG